MSRPARLRQPKPRIDGWKTRAFSATVRFGQSDSSWKTGRSPSALARAADQPRCSSPATTSRPRSGVDAAVQDMHQRRLAGAVVADDADAFAFSDRKIDAVQSPDGAVGFRARP